MLCNKIVDVVVALACGMRFKIDIDAGKESLLLIA